jgi:DNA-binding phage protein
MILQQVIGLINEANISQLVRDADVSRSQLYRIKEGLTDPGLETVERILKALGYSLKLEKQELISQC